jgi:tetratricopeptide (TPR) repeat protein
MDMARFCITLPLMKALRARFNPVVAALLAFLALAGPLRADSTQLDALFQQLQTVDDAGAPAVEAQIWAEWSKSGSPVFDLLFQRGHEAMNQGDLDSAIGHFTALIDHDPEFAEAWNARATAFFNKGELGPSIADIQHVLALNPLWRAGRAGDDL